MAALAGKGQDVFMTAIFALHTGKTVVRVAAVEIAVYDLLQVRPPEAVLPGEMIVIDPDKEACFKCIPATLDGDLKNSANIWFAGERTIEILILVDQPCADYFKRRKVFPTQEIREEKSDGSLIASFLVGIYGEIRNILKSWLPNAKILAPEELTQEFIADMKGWLKRQEEM
jgi:hypothetical protein